MNINGRTQEEQDTWDLFHRLWSKAVGTQEYNKEEWKKLEAKISNLMLKGKEKVNG